VLVMGDVTNWYQSSISNKEPTWAEYILKVKIQTSKWSNLELQHNHGAHKIRMRKCAH
jgi:hypothetical protein